MKFFNAALFVAASGAFTATVFAAPVGEHGTTPAHKLLDAAREQRQSLAREHANFVHAQRATPPGGDAGTVTSQLNALRGTGQSGSVSAAAAEAARKAGMGQHQRRPSASDLTAKMVGKPAPAPRHPLGLRLNTQDAAAGAGAGSKSPVSPKSGPSRDKSSPKSPKSPHKRAYFDSYEGFDDYDA